MRFLCITVVLIGSLATLCLMPESAPARGRRSCRPVSDAPPMYSAPHVYSVPPMYSQRPYSYQQPYAPAPPRARSVTNVTVGAYDNYFEPKTINVQPGTTVKWVNHGEHGHTVTSSDGRWDSGDIPPGGTYSVTFQRPGTYYYYCRHHTEDRMQGTIVIGSGGQSGGYSCSRSSGYWFMEDGAGGAITALLPSDH